MAGIRALRHQAAIVTALIGALIVALMGASLLAGCSSASRNEVAAAPASTGASPSTGAAPAYCAAATQLEASVRALGSVDVLNGGLNAVQAGLNKVRTDLNAFQAAAVAQYGPQVTAMRNSLSGLTIAMQNALANLNSSTITAVVVAGVGVVSAYGALRDAIASRCG